MLSSFAFGALKKYWWVVAVGGVLVFFWLKTAHYQHKYAEAQKCCLICEANHAATQAIIQANAAKYDQNIKSYEYAIEQTVTFYDDKLIAIDRFEENTDEDKCQNAKRLLDGFKY